MKKRIKQSDIEKIIKGAMANLVGQYREIRGKAGWHIVFGTGKIGVIATAQILLIFKHFGQEFDFRLRVLEYLLKSQIRSSDSKTNGGWAVVTNFPGAATLEATCWVLLALFFDGYADHPKVKAGLDWLLRNMVKGFSVDEGWGMVPGDVSRVYTTCLGMKVLKVYGKAGTEEYSRALNWLYKIQNLDGGWGTKEGSPSSIVYTSRVIIMLKGNGHAVGENLQRAITWLESQTGSLQQTKDNAKHEHHEIVEFEGRRISFHHMPVQLALTALIISGKTDCVTVFDGVNDLVMNNGNCYWQHPSFTNINRKPLCAIFETLLVCKALKGTANNWPLLKSIGLQGNSLTFTKVSGPFSWRRFRLNFICAAWGKCFVLLCVLIALFRIVNLFPELNNQLYIYITMVILPLLIELLGYYLTEMRKDKRKLIE